MRCRPAGGRSRQHTAYRAKICIREGVACRLCKCECGAGVGRGAAAVTYESGLIAFCDLQSHIRDSLAKRDGLDAPSLMGLSISKISE